VITHLELRRHLSSLERSLGEEQRAKEALRVSETFYETLVESLPSSSSARTGPAVHVRQPQVLPGPGQVPAGHPGRTDHDFYPAHLADKYHRTTCG